MNFNALTDYDINQLEYCFLCEKTKHTSSAFPIFIPKLMPLIGIGKPKKTNITINNNIFANCNECKLTTEKNIPTQNYLTLKRFGNANLERLQENSRTGLIPEGTKFICCIMDGNIRDIYLTDMI
jgi:hypothetical protein